MGEALARREEEDAEALAPRALERDPVQARWEELCESVGRTCPDAGLQKWLGRVHGVTLLDGRLILRLRGRGSAKWVEYRYREALQQLVQARFGPGVRLRIESDNTVGGALSALGLRPEGGRILSHQAPPPFVLTDENRSVHRALLEAARRASSEWAHWTVVGPEGTGKSHLLRTFVHVRQRRQPTENWRMLRGLEFYREFSAAARAGQWSAFRGKMLAHDGWVFDDLHELAGKRRCQEQLAQMLEHHLAHGRKAVFSTRVLSSSPREFVPQLRSLVHSGVRLNLPELSTASRAEVLRQRAPCRQLPEGWIQSLAETRRPLKDCLDLCFDARRYVASLGRTPTLRELRSRFPEVGEDARPEPMDHLLDRCAGYVGVPRSAIVLGSRSRGAALGRHLCIYLALDVCGVSRPTVRRWLGALSPSVIPYARRKIEGLRGSDPRLDGFVREVSGEVVHGQQLLF